MACASVLAAAERSLQGDQRVPFDQSSLREPLEPPAGGLGASAGVGGEREALDQPGHPIGVLGRLGVVDGQLRQPVGLAPGRRPSLELLDQVGLAPLELRAEQVAEQMVVLVPLAMPVQRDTEAVEQGGFTVDGGGSCCWMTQAHDSPSWRPWPTPQMRPNRIITSGGGESIGRATQARRDR